MTTQPSDWAVARAVEHELGSAMPNPCSPQWVFDAIMRRARELDASGGGQDPITYGLRRKGTTEIIGLIPPKIHAMEPTAKWFVRDYEEFPLYAAPRAAEAGDTHRLQFLIDNHAVLETNGYGDWRVVLEWMVPTTEFPYADSPRAAIDAAIDAAMGAVGAGPTDSEPPKG